MSQAALLFQFPDDRQAALAGSTLEELGYEPQLHEGGRLHIHVHNEDLTSALEIVQCYAGQLMEHVPAEAVIVTDVAYGMDTIPIPAHTVNEDWDDHYLEPSDIDATAADAELVPDDGSYDHFDSSR